MPSYTYTIKAGSGAVRPKKAGRYPWPCRGNPERTIELLEDDVLGRAMDGTYAKHTGLMCFGIKIPDDHVEAITEDVTLAI